MSGSSLLFIGMKGCVVALDKSNGQEVWRARLTGSEFVNVVLEGDNLYAATHGEIFCLSPVNGEVRWHNPLKGLGFGLVSIGLPGGQDAASAAKWYRDQAAAAAAGTTVTSST